MEKISDRGIKIPGYSFYRTRFISKCDMGGCKNYTDYLIFNNYASTMKYLCIECLRDSPYYQLDNKVKLWIEMMNDV